MKKNNIIDTITKSIPVIPYLLALGGLIFTINAISISQDKAKQNQFTSSTLFSIVLFLTSLVAEQFINNPKSAKNYEILDENINSKLRDNYEILDDNTKFLQQLCQFIKSPLELDGSNDRHIQKLNSYYLEMCEGIKSNEVALHKRPFLMEDIIDKTQEILRATSYGEISYWWRSDDQKSYIGLIKKLIKRGVVVKRLFICDDNGFSKMREIIEEQKKMGVQVKRIHPNNYNEILKEMTKPHSKHRVNDYIIIDNNELIELEIYKKQSKEEKGVITFAKDFESQQFINKRIEIFDDIYESEFAKNIGGEDKLLTQVEEPIERPINKSASLEWTMVSFLTEEAKNLIVYKAPQIICDRVKEMTGGNFIINIDVDASQKISTDYILTEVNSGNIECGYSGVYYTSKKYRPLYFAYAIPFGLSPQEHTAWLFYKQNPGDKLTYVQKIYEKVGLKDVIAFPGGATGSQMGGWFNKKIESIADFQGLRMRIPGLGADILREFCVKTDQEIFRNPLAIKEIKAKLEDGEIDAAEWIGPYDDLQLGLDEVAKYYYYPGWWEPSTTFDVQVNKDAWNQLPRDYKAIFKAACFETYTKVLAEYDRKNAEKLQKIQESGKINIQAFSEEILKKAEDNTIDLLELYSSDPIFKEVYEEWNNFKSQIRCWTNTSLDWHKFSQ